MKGTHGTCASRAQGIKASSFRLSSIGLAGKGVYFWSYYEDDELLHYAEALAISWWKSQEEKNVYSKCEDKTCVVIKAEISVKEGLFIDLEGHDLKGRMITFVNKIYNELSNNQHKSKRKELSKAYDLFVSMIEQEVNKKVDVIRIAVRTPSNFMSPIDFGITGLPSCYIVKNVNCIHVLSYDKVEGI